MKVIYEPKGRAGEYCPLAANLYKGCEHGCRYCYVPGMVHRDRGDFHAAATVREGAIASLEADLKIMQSRGDRRPVFLSFTTDPYQPIDERERLTSQAIMLMHHYGVPAMLLTKGGKRATLDSGLLGPNDWFGVTLTLTSADKTEIWEPGAAPPSEREDSLRWAREQGARTWVSIEPVLNPDSSLALIRDNANDVDMFKVGKMNHFPEIEKCIDWRKFGRDAESLLKSLGKEYYIKADLRECMK